MEFNKIEEIRVGSNPPGTIIDGKSGNVFAIVSANYSQNYDKAPSKFSLSVIGVDSNLEMREYLGINENGRSTPGGKQDATFAEANMESIYIGEGVHVASRFRTFFSFTGFLVSFSESISAGERT